MIVDRRHRMETGARVRRFVQTHWQPREVARRYLQLVEEEIPPSWVFDPSETSYVYGCCAPDSWIRELVRRVVQTAGAGGLMVSDKPDLERQLLAFGNEGGQRSETAAA